MSEVKEIYYPGHWTEWEQRKPEHVGMRADDLQRAIDFSVAHENPDSRDLALVAELKLEEPYPEVIGPMKERGPLNGIVLRHGYIVAEWGDTSRVDMTFSVSKSYLSTVAGLAFDRGLIRDVHHHVGEYVKDGGFDSPHNAAITWHHMLNQTSDWQGTLWDKPDWADRPEGPKSRWTNRELNPPGTRWKYNDARVNRLALSLLRVWRQPLPRVLRENIMDPIGASPTWEWHGYDNSWVTIDGFRMQSVSGGGHWGGGMWISTRDHARFGYFCLRNGKWRDRQLLSEEWIKMARTPTGNVLPTEPTGSGQSAPAENMVHYGYMNWFLNTDRLLLPSAPESSYFHAGNGANIIWVDPEHDLVVVVRWLQRPQLDRFIGLVLASVEEG